MEAGRSQEVEIDIDSQARLVRRGDDSVLLRWIAATGEFGKNPIMHGVPLLHEEVAARRHRVERSDVGNGTVPHVRGHLGAVDIGQKLGTGAYLSALRRTQVGEYNIGDSLGLEEVASLKKIEKSVII